MIQVPDWPTTCSLTVAVTVGKLQRTVLVETVWGGRAQAARRCHILPVCLWKTWLIWVTDNLVFLSIFLFLFLHSTWPRKRSPELSCYTASTRCRIRARPMMSVSTCPCRMLASMGFCDGLCGNGNGMSDRHVLCRPASHESWSAFQDAYYPPFRYEVPRPEIHQEE
jgi:hypothetical protein